VIEGVAAYHRATRTRRVGGIDSMAEGHWTVDFRHAMFAHLQGNSENDGIPHIGS